MRAVRRVLEDEALALRLGGAAVGAVAASQGVSIATVVTRIKSASERAAHGAAGSGAVTVTLLGRSNGDIVTHFEVTDTRRGRNRRDGLRVSATHGGGRVVENWSGTQWREMVRWQPRDLTDPLERFKDQAAVEMAWQRVYG